MPLLHRLAATLLLGVTLALSAHACDLQSRQNGIRFSAEELRRIVDSALPAAYDQRFPDHSWTTYLLRDAHADQGLVAITLGLNHRILSPWDGAPGLSTSSPPP